MNRSKIRLAAAAAAMFAFSLFGADAPKNVILFIGDGMSVPQRMVADEFSRKAGLGPLAMNSLPFSAVTRTCSANSLVTDSAAAATAIACGEKTRNGSIGVDKDGNRLVSCAEAARDSGRKVGIASTVTITHATPAGFYGHRPNRGMTYEIAIDLADSGFDFFAGGGLDNRYKDSNSPIWEGHGNAYNYAESNGYTVVRTKADFLALKPGCGKILTRFRDDALATSIDAGPRLNEPTVAEITEKAIELLECPQGFFLMVEGGRIDWAGHANDAATNLRDVLALDDAVKVALKWQESHPDTLVIVTGDHETGGMSMGFAGTGYALYMERLANQTMSVGTFEHKFRRMHEKAHEAGSAVSYDEVKALMTEAFGFTFNPEERDNPMYLHTAEREEVERAFKHDIEFMDAGKKEITAYDGEKRMLLGGVCRNLMSHKCGIGWSSGAHTAMPVLTTSKGPGAEKFTGYIENTDISRTIKSFMNAGKGR